MRLIRKEIIKLIMRCNLTKIYIRRVVKRMLLRISITLKYLTLLKFARQGQRITWVGKNRNIVSDVPRCARLKRGNT